VPLNPHAPVAGEPFTDARLDLAAARDFGQVDRLGSGDLVTLREPLHATNSTRDDDTRDAQPASHHYVRRALFG
jgi:hypothetical protein